jgi:hypothetical protein
MVFYRIAIRFKEDLFSAKSVRRILEREESYLVIFCLSWVFITLKLNPSSAFLYSTTIVPLLIILIHRFLNLQRRYDRILLYATVAVVITNNTVQILKFRAALSVL